MLSDRVRAPALALIMAALLFACGDDEVASDGGDGGAIDAAMDAGMDAGADTGEDLCPGLLTFEALVTEAVSRDPVVAVAVAEVGGSASTTSAPNGRAQLCLPSDADAQVRSSAEGYLERLDTLSADALEIASAAAQPYPLDVLTTEAAEALREQLEVPADDETTLLLVSVVSYPDAQPLVGATVSIDKDHAGSFASDASGAFLPGETADIGDGRVLLFANVASGGEGEDGQAVITVTPPGDFGGTCAGPSTVELEPGGLSGALFACQ